MDIKRNKWDKTRAYRRAAGQTKTRGPQLKHLWHRTHTTTDIVEIRTPPPEKNSHQQLAAPVQNKK